MNFQNNSLTVSEHTLYKGSTQHPAPAYIDAFTPGNHVSNVQSDRTNLESDLKGITRKLSECESVKNSFLAKKQKLEHLEQKNLSKNYKCECPTCYGMNTMKPKEVPRPRGLN
ncbi:hypothetical protein JO84_gp202 [Aureococcus anophagefferens virus]|uniref:Uncharacterized protein n=1 Tax=Aureococcus anophagefferens virus TaxID=1474867 RepID=A0A076FGN0_9VIRU|nr:hypothetical protein JO84_gp202 [Aureococcus anophagefferens virus]AII17245.1 hypothetical protein AaV_273 [Aureococcus anophagefferens virus]UOG94187.1 hypothetical protein MKD35_146 [Aureococcus anophagefferens virus]